MNDEKHTVTPKLTITAEECRQNALRFAVGAPSWPTEAGNVLAMTGLLWATIGQLCMALGDPDEVPRDASRHSVDNPARKHSYDVTINDPDEPYSVESVNALRGQRFPL